MGKKNNKKAKAKAKAKDERRDALKLRQFQEHRLALRRPQLRAAFDIAQTTTDNEKHWSYADSKSADAAASATIRRTIRNRSRYEVTNNSYARGIVLTLAHDVVGPGPALQMTGQEEDTNRQIEQDFAYWMQQTRLAEKIRTMRMAKAVDGEAFGLLTTNEKLDSEVKLDLRLVEADQFTDPDPMLKKNVADGIFFDDAGNPVRYRMLLDHPGSEYVIRALQYRDVPAKYVLHYFRADRPDQHRGLPDLMPALPLFACLRRYTLATLAAAESCADIALAIQTRNPPVDEDAAGIEAMDTVELERRLATVLPEGYELGQVKPEQPSTTYAEFKRELITEIARCLDMPYNVAACDSSAYNYASGRLDHQTYFKSIDVERSHIELVILDRILREWLREYMAAKSQIAPGDIDFKMQAYSHQWFWCNREHVDPVRDAVAQGARLKNNTTTLADEYARQGRDWERAIRQRAKETDLLRELGLPVPEEEGQKPGGASSVRVPKTARMK